MKDKNEKDLRNAVIQSVRNYYDAVYGKQVDFAPGDRIPYAGRIFDDKEITNAVEAALDFWLTSGRYTEEFESRFSRFLGVKHCALVNSGSSANLIAFMALTSPSLKDRRIVKGDEVITVAAGFPTTVTPIIQYGAVPVFVDIDLPYYNIDCTMLDAAVSEKTKAVMLAHTLGNPFDLKNVKEFCDKHNLWLIEDNCDALGSKYYYNGKWVFTGSVGSLGTSSFYPPHHITFGEGGAIYTSDPRLIRLAESFRDWGRDCWCPSGHDNTCKKRFSQKFGELPDGYDHKYVYSHFGYNLKVTEMQSAIGCAQLEKLPSFVESRRRNWNMLRRGLSSFEDIFILPEPTPDSDPSWFGFLITLRDNAGFDRSELVDHLESRKIQTRMLFAGNLIKHPCFDEMRGRSEGFRVVGDLKNTDTVMDKTFWIGVYPGLNKESIQYIIDTTAAFVKTKRKSCV